MALQVPFTLQDEDIPDDWECSQNAWDRQHNSCSIPQALTDEEIDEILATQVCHSLVQNKYWPEGLLSCICA